MKLDGGCYCGAVRYEVDGDVFHRTLCHCEDCRRVSAAPAMAWFSVLSEALRFTRGKPREFHSSTSVTRSFCADCGTALTYRNAAYPDETDVTTCSLDKPDAASPQDHTFAAFRLDWMHTSDTLPAYARTRAGP